MAVYIEAPYPAPEVTIVIPNPKFDNSVTPTADITVLYSMDGTVYSYVKKRGTKQKHLWSFNVSKDKSEELFNFLQAYSSSKVKVEWGEDFFIGYFLTNPQELRTVEKAAGWPGGEMVQISLEFQESNL